MTKDLAENLYYKEEERKAELLNLLNFVLAILGLAFGWFAYYVNVYLSTVSRTEQTNPFWYWALLIFLVVTFICIASALACVICAFHGHTVHYIASPRGLSDYYKELLAYYQQMQMPNAGEAATKDFDEFLIEQLIEAAEQNDRLNQKRKKVVHKATGFCIASIILLSLTFIPFFFVKRCDSTSTRISGFGDALTVRVQGETKDRKTTREDPRHVGSTAKQPDKLETKPGQSATNAASQTDATGQTDAAVAAPNQRERGQNNYPKEELTQ